MSSGVSNDLNDLWGLNSADIFVVGSYGTVLHYNGSGWTWKAVIVVVNSTNVYLRGIRFEGEDLGPGNSAARDGIDIITIGTDDADRRFLNKLASATELSMKVSEDAFQQTIVSAANLLSDGK
jgi:hypothetical protein